MAVSTGGGDPMYERNTKSAIAGIHTATLQGRPDNGPDNAEPNHPVRASVGQPHVVHPFSASPSGTDWLALGQHILSVLWARRTFAICVAILFGILIGTARWIAGPSYTASLIIKPDLRGRQAPAGAGPSPTIDGASLVESQMGLIQSHAVAKRVVEKLGMIGDVQRPTLLDRTLRSWFPSAGDNAALNWVERAFRSWRPTAVDREAAQLISKLTAQRIQLSYLIRVTYRAKSPQEAASVLNAVASEYIRAGYLQLLADRYHVANASLAELSRTYGERHPLILRAERDAENQRIALEQEEEKSLRLMSSEELAASGLVLPAEAITIPTGLGVIGAVFLGLLLGLVLAAIAILFKARHSILAGFRRANAKAA